jgi:hypothetical protein
MGKGTSMEGKFTAWQKIVLTCTFLVIMASAGIRMIMHAGDQGAIIVLSFMAIVLFCSLSVAALFPATWRMTTAEKNKISDVAQYQKKYASVLVVVNALLSLVMIFLIWIV